MISEPHIPEKSWAYIYMSQWEIFGGH